MRKKLLTGLNLCAIAAILVGCGPQTSSIDTSDPTSGTTSDITSVTPSEDPTSTITTSEIPSEEPTSEEPSSEIIPTLSITNKISKLWLDETFSVDTEVENSVDGVIYTSSDNEVATVDAAGLVTPLKVGEVTITATLSSNATIKDTVTFNVVDTVLDTAYGFGNLDYTNLKAENPSVSTTKANAEWPYVEGVFKNVLSQHYYVEASFDLTEIKTDWVWNNISVGHRNDAPEGEYVFRGLGLSYGDGTNKKTVMMETPNEWGLTTDRSQVWGQNGLADLDFGVDSPKVTLATLRDGNEYYYFINDKLMWVEKHDERFKDVDTKPAFVLRDMHAVVSDFVVITEPAALASIKDEDETNRVFYPSYADNVEIDSVAKTIAFKNAIGSWPFDNIKDNAAKSLGDAFSLPKGVNSTLSFKFKFDSFVDPDIAAVGVTLNQWGLGTNNFGANRAISFTFGANNAGATFWDSNGNLGATPQHLIAYPAALNEVNTVTITRVLVEGTTTFEMTINDQSVVVPLAGDGYDHAYTISFGAVMLNATISDYLIS